MASHGRNGLGASERLLVELPAPCIGHPLRGNVTCPREGTLTLWGVIEKADGSPLPVLVTACDRHVGPVQHYLETLGPDPIERWATSTFFEHAQSFRDSGLDWHRLTRIA